MNSCSLCSVLSFTNIAINQDFLFHSSYGQKDHIAQGLWIWGLKQLNRGSTFPFDSVAICQHFLSILEHCTFLWITGVLPFFSWLGKYDFRQSLQGISCHSLVDVCLLINLTGRFLLHSQEETLIHIAHVSILWRQWLVELQKMFKILVMIRVFKVAKE